ncbi:M55 family metallopeptidase [Saliniramus sp.]|uniref:M55 family metallopeptidase n=1 Tax=Saliniramus sp. TaxID=2986772 RepID=UPI002D004DEB|nr:M55 family metallopeptidase [Saliniramus sp.]HMB10175.1 M55 family metallopeptidase [Saliniramus sp.]
MKVFISVDIEGCAGITHWDEARRTHADYAEFREIMTNEALAAIRGARQAGATEIVVKDAHASGRNLILDRLPPDIRIVRAWAGHPLCMVQGLDDSFGALMMIGYHAAAGSEANALAHTLSLAAAEIRLDGRRASEFLIHALAGAMLGVPTVFVSGDAGLMTEIADVAPQIGRCAVKQGYGQSTLSMTPAGACAAIEAGAAQALSQSGEKQLLAMPQSPALEITYNDSLLAERHRWYPGAEHVGDRTIRLAAQDYFEILRALNYLT